MTTPLESRLLRELRYIAGISNGQVKRVADAALGDIAAAGAAPQPAQDVNAELVETAYDKVQQQIVERYRVEKSAGGFWPCCVKAGDGTMDIFVGSKKQAEHVRQALQTACLDGAFIATASKAAPQGEQQ